MKNKLPAWMIGLGAVIAAVCMFADVIGLGDKGGIPAMQILGAEAGLLLALVGTGLWIRQRQAATVPAAAPRNLLDWVLNQPPLTWLVIGFLIAFVLCFLFPAIYNSERKFHYFTDYLRERDKIGFDTRLMLEHIGYWFSGEQTPKYLFPPLTTILFTPLLLVRYPYNYYIVTVVTLVSYLLLNLCLPLLFNKKENRLIVYFIFAVSIFSYGLQFELDTGQFYTAAMLLSVAAVYIFHRYPSYRIFAYILFCISVQLKVFPAIFVFLFVDDWRAWKTNLKRFFALGVANFALLFLLGFSYFSLFTSRLLESTNTIEIRYNHSVQVYVGNLAATGYGLSDGSALLAWIRGHVSLIQTSLSLYIIACFIVALIVSYKRNARGADFSLLMVSLIVGLTLPSISHDYNLPLLATPFVLWMSIQRLPEKRWMKALTALLTLAASFAYAVTLFPSNARPAPLENSFPALMILLTAVTVLSVLPQSVSPVPEADLPARSA